MSNLLSKIKATAQSLGVSNKKKELGLINDLLEDLNLYKQHLINELNNQNKPLNKTQVKIDTNDFKVEKIAEEKFLTKPVTIKNYYDGDYLEKFSEIRTSDLSYCGVLDVHNKFWSAHEIICGNIFATIPLELISNAESSKLTKLNWDIVKTDIYVVTSRLDIPRHLIIDKVEELFENYLFIREVSGDVFMIIDFKL